MRSSNYIYIVSYDINKSILFSGTTKRFIILDNNTLESIVLILRNPYEFLDSHSTTIGLLKRNGFLIDDETDEISQLVRERKLFVESKEYKSTILPTFDCNYNCWYCIQKHVKDDTCREDMDLIIRHVKNYIVENDIESYVLSWFGGEPLTNPRFIDYVSSELVRFCAERGIEFSGSITTNGSLLTMENINLLRRNNINYYQITLDGDKTTHDKIKHSENEESSFDTILNNIVNLLHHNKNANLTLRFNYTCTSIKKINIVDEIDAIVPINLRHRISIDPHKVWQINECDIPIKDLETLVSKFHNSGYAISTDNVFSICYVEKIHHNTIYYNGRVDKCDNNGIDQLRGYLDKSGHIKWKSTPIFQEYNPLDNGSCCRICKYYPLCYGCCPIRREERIVKNGKITCEYENFYEVFEHRILEYCVRCIAND